MDFLGKYWVHIVSVALFIIFGVSGSVLTYYGTIIPATETSICTEWGLTSERFGLKCYDSGYFFTCPNDPCYCIKRDFSNECLPKPTKHATNVLLIIGIILLLIDIIIVIPVTTYIFVFRKRNLV
jgi:hypothetical protein